MDKILPLLHTVPIVVIGTRHPDYQDLRPNYTTIGDVAIAGIHPPLIMISLHERHLGRRAIDASGRFSVNVPSQEFLSRVDYCGMVSGNDTDKSNVFATVWHEDVPYANELPIALFCQVLERVQVEKRIIFIAKVERTIVKDGLKLEDLHGIQYGLDNRYYGTGVPIGEGYHEGASPLDHSSATLIAIP
ncbi:MAG: hypothetical protein A2017_17535 [Lentisphaerae bacterium GWF2_44_16]|nr:MAG: hypothetical protein A2017_17535 [Lentisphaerae bacterium GWF2_44_16]